MRHFYRFLIFLFFVWGGTRLGFYLNFKDKVSDKLSTVGFVVDLKFNKLNFKIVTKGSVVEGQKNLKEVIDYLEINNLNSGYTSLFRNDLDESLLLFYSELNDFYLKFMSSDVESFFQESRVLWLSSGGLKIPSGISIYPYNHLFFWSLIFLLIVYSIFFIKFNYFDEKGVKSLIFFGLPHYYKYKKEKKAQNNSLRGKKKEQKVRRSFMSRFRSSKGGLSKFSF